MAKFVCKQFDKATEVLNKVFCSKKDDKKIALINEAIDLLQSTYGPLKDNVYYANKICKETYVLIRELRHQAFVTLESALNVLKDTGGCSENNEVQSLVCE